MIHIIANGFGVLSTLCFIAPFQVKSNIVNCETPKSAKFQRFLLLKTEQLLTDLWYNKVDHTIYTTSSKGVVTT